MAAPRVYGNWKMNLDYVEAVHLIQQLAVLLKRRPLDHVEVGVAPPFVDLRSVGSVLEAERLSLTLLAQHASDRDAGPYTGEVSVPMLERLGVRAVLVGHSERRTLFAMDDATVAATLARVTRGGLDAVLCVGEDREVRERGGASDFVEGQLVSALAGLAPEALARVCVAYEPRWAIGTGVNAEPADVAAVNGVIRRVLRAHGAPTDVLYGGSVTAENAAALVTEGSTDGFLVGGASLRADAFYDLCRVVDDCYAEKR